MRHQYLMQIELKPRIPGPLITGVWEQGDILYLVGLGGACRWTTACDGGALPLAVAIRKDSGATIAPVHPLCHVEQNSTTIRLGTETFDVEIIRNTWRRYAKLSIALAIVVASFIGGWCLKMQATPASPAIAHGIEDVYVF